MTPTYNYAGSTPRSYLAAGTFAIGEAMKLDTDGSVIRTTAITDDVEGIAINAGAAGDQCVLQQAGVAKVLASTAAVTTGDQVMPTASGAGRCSTAAGATAKSFGKALTTTAGDGQFFACRLALGVNGPANS